MAGVTTARCDRARQWASLRMDGELSELEALMLERHVAGCDACRDWQAGVVRATELIRAAPLETPSRGFEAPRPGQARFPLRYRLGVAAVVAAAALGSLIGAMLERPSRTAPTSPAPQLSFDTSVPSRVLPEREPPQVPRRPVPPAEDAV